MPRRTSKRLLKRLMLLQAEAYRKIDQGTPVEDALRQLGIRTFVATQYERDRIIRELVAESDSPGAVKQPT